MRSVRECRGRAVVSEGPHEEVGRVEQFVVAAPDRRVTALRISGPGTSHIVGWDEIRSFGEAVVVSSPASPRAARDRLEERALTGDFRLLGKAVVDDLGNPRGELEDVEFDERSGTLLRLVTSRGSLDAARLRAVGSAAIVVRAGPEQVPSRRDRL